MPLIGKRPPTLQSPLALSFCQLHIASCSFHIAMAASLNAHSGFCSLSRNPKWKEALNLSVPLPAILTVLFDKGAVGHQCSSHLYLLWTCQGSPRLLPHRSITLLSVPLSSSFSAFSQLPGKTYSCSIFPKFSSSFCSLKHGPFGQGVYSPHGDGLCSLAIQV